jgi:homoserine kinase
VRITVRVPATSANLGPGFDCFGLALDLCNEVTVDTDAEPGVTWEGEGADELPTDGTDMISRAIAYTVEQQEAKYPGASIPPVALGRGLGSSAAAAVAGVAVARVLLGDAGDPALGPTWTAGLASMFEGHWDNATAAALGGFVIRPGGHRFELHRDVRVALIVPRHLRVSTHDARAAVPDPIPLWRAVSNIGNASALAIALTQQPSLIMGSLQDMIHEDARIAIVPEVGAVRRRLSEANVPVCLSGSGPSLLAFELDDSGEIPNDLGPGWEVWRPGINTDGVEVVVED